jgi:hypothetical protein
MNIAVALQNYKGTSLVHQKLSASQKAMLAAMAANKLVAIDFSSAQLGRGLSVSASMISRAGDLLEYPALVMAVLDGELSVIAALQFLKIYKKAEAEFIATQFADTVNVTVSAITTNNNNVPAFA